MTSAAKARILKRAALWLGGIAAFIFLAITIVVNFVLTNDRLNPLIKSYADQYLDADVQIGNAGGAFFTTFPYIGVKLDSVRVLTNAFHGGPRRFGEGTEVIDSLRTRRDTLAEVKTVAVGLNLIRYLLSDSDKLTIGVIMLDEPHVRALTDSAGRNSWDVLRPTDDAEGDTSSTEVTVHHIKIRNGRIGYFSRPDQMGVFLDSLNLSVDGKVGLDRFDADLKIDIARTSMGVKDVRYLRRLPLGLDGNLVYDSGQNRFLLDEMCVRVAGADIDLDGWVSPDSTGATMDIEYGLDAPSVKKVFAAIPKSIVSSPVDVKNGAVDMKGRISGRLSDTEIPLIKGEAYLDKIHAQYKGRPDDIEDLTAKFNMLIDQGRPDSSYVNLDIFHFKGGESEVSAIVKVSQLLTDAMMDCQVKAHVDFGNLQRVVPFDNTEMSGIMDADVKTHFSIADIRNRDYGKAKLDGSVNVSRICITNDTTGFDLDIDASLSMKTDTKIWIKSTLDSLSIQAGSMRLKAKDGGFEAESEFAQDTTHVVPLAGRVHVDRFFFMSKSDSIAIFAKNIRTDDHIDPEKDDPRKPLISHELRVDTIFAGIVGNMAVGHGFKVTAQQESVSDTAWHTRATLEYAHLGAKPTVYRKPVSTDDFRLTLDGDSVNVNHVTVSTGNTTMRASGYVSNLFTSLRSRKQVTLNLSLDADTIDCNEIMANVVQPKTDTTLTVDTSLGVDTTLTSMTANGSAAADSAAPPFNTRMILIPRHIKLSVSAKAKAIKWSTLTMSNVDSQVLTKEGAAHVSKFIFNIGDARSISIMSYKAWPMAGKARANIFSRWEKTDIETLTTALGLDTIVPALKPVKGKLECYMAAEVEFDSLMNVVAPTARAAIHLGGEKLTLMDNDSFRKIGKKLMFKNKDRNVIDTLSMNVLLDSGNVQVLPFVISIDRYRMACAGSQDLDMNMKYHVSILKSPLPFKAGVNIVGTPEDFDVDITTAKLKKIANDAAALAWNDTLSLMMRMSVLRNCYILAGQPVPQYLRQMKGLDSNPRFAIAIQADSDTEESLREAEMARRAAAAEAKDSTAAGTDTAAIAPSSAE